MAEQRTVFVPVSRAEARALRDAPWTSGRPGFAVTSGLRSAEADPSIGEEELDFVAQEHAGAAALSATDDPLRLVLAVRVTDDRVSEVDDDSLGAVEVGDVAWADVRAVFCDEAEAGPAVAAARTAARAHDLGAALVLPAVAELLGHHDLLWYDPSELDDLP